LPNDNYRPGEDLRKLRFVNVRVSHLEMQLASFLIVSKGDLHNVMI